MSTVLPLLLLGFVLGLRHATDPDHVVAVSTIVSRERTFRGAALIGALWGLGHTVTITLVGGAIVGFGLVIPKKVELSMELGVAVMLVGLGVASVWGTLKRFHEIAHGDHSHEERSLVERLGRFGVARPLIVGIVHGMAGSAAVALLVLTTVHDVTFAMLYLALFGVGTMAGMMTLTTLLAAPFALAAKRGPAVATWLSRATGVASVGLGAYLVYEIGVVERLFLR